METCQKHGFRWKARPNTDVADGPNRFSLAGLVVEKKDGEGTTPQSARIGFLEHGMKKFLDCVIFDGESFVHASFNLLQLSVCFCTCFQ